MAAVADFTVEVTGAAELVAVLTRAQSRALPEVEAIVVKGALNIKQGAQRRVSGLRHAPAYPASIGFDVYHLPGSVLARIGPDKDKRQGALGNLLRFGSVNNPPIPHLDPDLDEEAPRYERSLADLAVRLLS